METYICEFSEEKIKEWRLGILGKSSCQNQCSHFIALFTKKRRIQIWSLEISQFRFSIIFGRYSLIKEKEGRSWCKRICFKPLPPPLLHHQIEVSKQGQTPSSFQTYYLGKGVEESQFLRQGRMVSGGVP